MEKVWLKNYEPQEPHSIDYPRLSLYQLIRKAAYRYSEQAAVHFMGRELKQ